MSGSQRVAAQMQFFATPFHIAGVQDELKFTIDRQRSNRKKWIVKRAKIGNQSKLTFDQFSNQLSISNGGTVQSIQMHFGRSIQRVHVV